MRGEKLDLFGGGNDLQSVANDIYGGSMDIPDSGRVVARPTPITTIWADVRQPRRAIPLTIRMHWNGDPADVPALLKQWLAVAEAEAGEMDVESLLNGAGDGIDTDNFPSVAQEFMALVRLAQGIHADGLINPITIIESDGKLLIESGERRWLAYHLLNMYLGETWAKIPASKGNTNDSVWRQAAENTQRRALNAIGMARQIALLIMAARGTPPMATGTQYQEYDEIVRNGVSDRRFYAQVADGNVHRIPRGMGERIQAAMGLGMEQISQYRALLRLTDDEHVNDALWTRADVENWPERALRDIATLTTVKVSEVIKRSQWTIEDLRALKETVTPVKVQQPQLPVTSEWMGKRVMNHARQYGTVIAVLDDQITVRHEDGSPRANYHFTTLTIVAPAPGPAPASPHMGFGFDSGFVIGDKVRTRTGHVGEVMGLSGRLVSVRTANGTTSHDYTMLTRIPAVAPAAAATPEAPHVPELRHFTTGDRVRTQYGRAGVIVTQEGSTVLVKWDNGTATSIHASNLWSDATPMITEADIEEEPDPDATPPVREYAEGVSIGGGRGIASGNVVSANAMIVFHNTSVQWRYLYHLRSIAQLFNDLPTATLLTDIIDITDEKARELHASGALRNVLDLTYAQVKEAMQVWMDGWLVATLQQVLDVAEG